MDGLGPTPSGREASVGRLVHRLRRLGEGQPTTEFTWRTSAEPVMATWDASVRKANENPKAILEDLRKTLTEYKSAY